VHRPVSRSKKKGTSLSLFARIGRYEKARKTVISWSVCAIKLIDALKPYKGGNEAFLVDELNNINKHKLLPTIERIVLCHDVWIGKRFMYKPGRPNSANLRASESEDYILRGGRNDPRIEAGTREALLPTLHYLVELWTALSTSSCQFGVKAPLPPGSTRFTLGYQRIYCLYRHPPSPVPASRL